MLNQSLAEDWAATVLKMFRGRIIELVVIDTGTLKNTLRMMVNNSSGGSVNKMQFFYKLYGEYVNQGTGKEKFIGNVGDLGSTPGRKAKRWYSPVFFREVIKLQEIIVRAAGQKAVDGIMKGLEEGVIMPDQLITAADFARAKKELGYA